MRRFRLVADFEFEAEHAEGAAMALSAHFASLGSDSQTPIDTNGLYLIACVDQEYLASLPAKEVEEIRRALENISKHMARTKI